MSLTEKYKDCEIKYITTSFATNDSIQIKYPANETGERFMKCVPKDDDNTDYQEILQWVADGNTIQEAD
jgi:hypothetical protein